MFWKKKERTETAAPVEGQGVGPVMPNALAFEYQRVYGSALGDLDIADLVNNPMFSGKCRVLSLSFAEKSFDDFLVQTRSLLDDGPNPRLVTQDAVQSFPK